MVDRVSGRTVLVTGAGQGMGAGIARAWPPKVQTSPSVTSTWPPPTPWLPPSGTRGIGQSASEWTSPCATTCAPPLLRRCANSGAGRHVQQRRSQQAHAVPRRHRGELEPRHGRQRPRRPDRHPGSGQADDRPGGGGGKIVNTASIASRQGYAEFVPYCASKFAVVAIIQAGGARALAGDHITVNGFSPGVVETPLWAQLDKDMVQIHAAEKEGDAFAAFASGALLGRAAQVADIVPTAVFLASADSEFITGQVMAIDGGMVLV